MCANYCRNWHTVWYKIDTKYIQFMTLLQKVVRKKVTVTAAGNSSFQHRCLRLAF